MATHMKISTTFLCAVVLWAVVESKYVRRMERSLTIEGKGSNLTEKLQQEEIHADGLQHFTFPKTSTQTTPSVSFREDPLILEDGNVQSLKNDDSIRILYDRKVTIDKESPNGDFPDEKNKTVKTKANDVIAFRYNQTGPLSNKRSEVLISHSYYEHSTSTVYDEDERDEKEREEPYSQEHHPVVGFTEPLKDDLEWRNVETKKKEKGKKEILEVVTVPTDHFKVDKPLKDNVIGGKLKEKNKDLISEALDEQRSTIRFRNSSSVSLSENDNNNTLGSLDVFKADSSIANNEESVGQSVNSVISSNGVNSDYAKRSRVKYSAANRAHDITNDTEAENSSASENQLVEEAAINTVQVPLNIEPQTTPPISSGTISSDKLKHHPHYQIPKPTDSTPTKIDIFEKLASPLPTAFVKPSGAFKQQLASKSKGLDPIPTVPITGSDDLADENLEKLSAKLPTKPQSLKKKSKLDHYAQPSEMYIPPTATAWTLVSMKAAAEDLKSARKPATPLDNNSSLPETITKTTVQQTTIPPVNRIKSFVPWSTRLLKSTTSEKPTTTSLSTDKNGPEALNVSVLEVPSLNEKENIIKLSSMSFENSPIASTNEEHTVIRSTQELERNMTETSINLIQASTSDIMVKDQSSTKSHDIMTTEKSTTTSQNESICTTSSTTKKEITSNFSLMTTSDNQTTEKENVIESKHVPELQINAEDKTDVQLENKIQSSGNIGKNTTINNEILSSDFNDNASDKNTSYVNENYNFVLTISSTTPTPYEADNSKTKNTHEFGDLDPLSDIIGDGGEESKSLEDDEEDEKPKQTTTLPGFDNFETTIMSDLDEEEDDEKYEDESIPLDKPKQNHTSTETLTQPNTTESTTDSATLASTLISNITDSLIEQTSPKIPHISTEIPVQSDTSNSTIESIKSTSSYQFTEISTRSSTTHLSIDVESTPPTSLQMPEMNSTSMYVTSFDIVSKENTTLVVTKTPTEGDINWYNVDTKPVNVTVEVATNKTNFVGTTLTAPIETTNEPDTTTETSKEHTTYIPETTVSVNLVFTPTTTVSPEPPSNEEKEVDEESEDVDGKGEIEQRACVDEVSVMLWTLCHDPQQLQGSIAAMFNNVSWEQVMLEGGKRQDCHLQDETNKDQDQVLIDVCFFDKYQKPSHFLKNQFQRLKDLRNTYNDFKMTRPPPMRDDEGFDNVFAAIVLSVIAAVCLVLLGILLIIVRKRQGRFNYGQRCTPVSLDDYSLDNISVYNSIRRKGHRTSKRSYGNPAFDDPGAPTHSINFAGLANFSSDREALDEEFSQIPMIIVKPDELPPGAESKNRYANVIPLPETRVTLQTKEGADPLDEYINANFVKGPKSKEKLFIACQAPLQSTVEDFWRMIWQQQTKVILMLTALTENGVDKCADYLPQLEITDCHRLFGDFQVTLKKHEVREKYIISTLQLKNLETNSWREVTHLWYSNWPAQGVPEDGNALIAFLIEARSYARGGAGPTVVHCSPGTGRTGTVIAIDLCIRDFETIRTVDIPRTVYALRRDRAGSVQTKDQYAFIYQVLNLYATKLTGGGMDSI